MTLSLKLSQVTIEKNGDDYAIVDHPGPFIGQDLIEIPSTDAIEMAKWILGHEGFYVS